MPFIDPDDTQPFPNAPIRRHRDYREAEWESGAGPGGSPKVAGGFEESRTGATIPTRGLNRKTQRYEGLESILIANRVARATAEGPTTVVLEGALGIIELRSPTGNNYDLSGTANACDCPDYWRIRQSGYDVALCKHCYIAQSKLTAVGGLGGLDKSCSFVADFLGIAVRTVQQLCQRGLITASHSHGVWVIPWTTVQQDEVAEYHSTMIGGGGNPFGE